MFSKSKYVVLCLIFVFMFVMSLYNLWFLLYDFLWFNVLHSRFLYGFMCYGFVCFVVVVMLRVFYFDVGVDTP